MRQFQAVLWGMALFSGICTTGCSRPDSFSLKGSVAGAENESLVLERAGFNGSWIAVDSTRTDKNGDFTISYDAPSDPEIFRLRMDGRYIYFPVDSTENISLSTSAAGYGRDYSFSGSEKAEKMRKFDMESLKAYAGGDSAMNAFKRRIISEIIIPGQGDILSYYVITKTIGGKPIFSVDNPADAGAFGAVANMFAQFRPDDPRAGMLANMAAEARKNKNKAKGRKTLLRAEETSIIDFTLPDKDGRDVTLSELTGKGKPVMVIFSPLNQEGAPEINRRIAELHRQYGAKVTFLQVCPDADRIAWREAALNLPWIALCDSRGTASPLLASYNVEVLPSFYFYNRNGELVKSTRDPNAVSGILAGL